MNNPFGSLNNNIVVNASEQRNEVVKKEKKVDLVKLYLASIPSLETVKIDLTEMAEQIDDEEIKQKINKFTEAILTIIEEILDLTKVAIRGVRQDIKDETQERPKITSDMLSSKMKSPFEQISNV